MAYDEVLADRLRELTEGEPGIGEQKMFGGLGFLVDGHLAVAAGSGGHLMVRCDPEQEERLLADEHAEPFEMRGRSMRGWLRVDQAGLGDDEALARWVEVGVAYARALPPKEPAR